MRSIYIDESGLSANESVVVVAGVMVDADRHWRSLRQYVDNLVKDYVLEEHQDGFVFHATELFHGTHKIPDKNRAHEALRYLLKAPEIFDLAVVFGRKRKRLDAKGRTRKQQRAILALDHAIAFSLCATAAEKYMRTYTPENEIAWLVVENNNQTQAAIKNMVKILRAQNLTTPGARNFYKVVSETATDCLPITRIVDSVNFQFKDDAILLQLADACAFILRRYFENRTTTEKFFVSLGGRDYKKVFGRKDLFASLKMFAWGSHRTDNAPVAEKDANQQALEEVEKITESDRDKGEDLLESEELKRQLREAKERLESGKPPRK